MNLPKNHNISSDQDMLDSCKEFLYCLENTPDEIEDKAKDLLTYLAHEDN